MSWVIVGGAVIGSVLGAATGGIQGGGKGAAKGAIMGGIGGAASGGLAGTMGAAGGAASGFGSAPAGVAGPAMANGGFFSSPLGALGLSGGSMTPPAASGGALGGLVSKESMKNAYDVLGLTSKMVSNPKDKRTIDLMRLSTGLAANDGKITEEDITSGPLADIASSVGNSGNQAEQERLRMMAAQQGGSLAPSTQVAPPAPRRLSDFPMPSVRLGGY